MGRSAGSSPEEVFKIARNLGLRFTYDDPGLFSAVQWHLSQRLLDVEEIEDVKERRVAERSLTEYVEGLRGIILDIEKRLLKIDLE